MDIVKTVKYAKKELLRSPAKSAVMGILTVVAIVYCGPVFWGLLPFGKSDPKSVAVTPASSAGPSISPPVGIPVGPRDLGTAATTAPVGSADISLEGNWTEVAKWIEEDALMRPVRRALEARDPFVDVVEESPQVVDKTTEEVGGPEPNFTIEQLGVTVRGVFVGRTPMASINDQVVLENGQFDVPHPTDPERRKLALELRRVTAEFVVVGFRDQSYRIDFNTDQTGSR